MEIYDGSDRFSEDEEEQAELDYLAELELQDEADYYYKNLKPLKLTRTKIALESFDRFIEAYNRKWEKTEEINNKTALLLLKAYDAAENVVRRAFYEDSKDRNSLDNCMLVGISWLRELVAKENN